MTICELGTLFGLDTLFDLLVLERRSVRDPPELPSSLLAELEGRLLS